MARRWSQVLLADVAEDAGEPLLALSGGGVIRFTKDRDGRGEGVSGLAVAARDPERVRQRARARGALREGGNVELCGVRIALVSA